MKLFRHKNMMGLIYSILIAIPFLSVLCRTAYVVVNKNAKDSYYGETINQAETITVDAVDLQPDITYTWTKENYNASFSGFGGYKYYLNEAKRNDTLLNYDYFVLYVSSQGVMEMVFYNSNSSLIQLEIYNTTPDTITFNFSYTTIYNNRQFNDYNSFIYQKYNKYSYLDNAFDYSISRFVDDNNWGTLNFFSWFDSLFININVNNNALYMHFINWYMNYTLFVSCAYILFLVIMWFINFARRLLERGMNYDW